MHQFLKVSPYMFAALLLTSCGLFQSDADRAMQKTPNYRSGYDDGCAAASTTGANPREDAYRDEALYESDRAYHAGWSSGFATCRNQTLGGSLPDNSLNKIPGQP